MSEVPTYILDRIDVSWISPNKTKFPLKVKKNSKAFSVNSIDIKNMGDGASRDAYGANLQVYPLDCIFFGDKHHKEAEEFYEALKENGVGSLQLSYGQPISVGVSKVQLGYNTTKKQNVSLVKVSFIESPIEFSYDTYYSFLYKRDVYNLTLKASQSTAGEFAEGIDVVSAGDKNSLISNFSSGLASVGSTLKGITEGVTSAVTEFTNVYSSIENSVFEVVEQPLLLAEQVMRLKEIPARLVSKFSDVKNSYKVLFETSLPNLVSGDMFFTREKKNEAYNALLFGGVAITGMAEGFLNVEYQTKAEAIEAVTALTETFDEYRTYLDAVQKEAEGVGTLDKQFVQSPDFLIDMSVAIQAVAGSLIQLSFDLKREFEFELTEPTTIINIACEYYPEDIKQDEKNETHDTLDYIIETNNLQNDEILLLPKGKMIKVYI